MELINILLLFCLVIIQLVWIFTSPFTLGEYISQVLKMKSGIGAFFSLILLLQVLEVIVFPLPFDIPIELKLGGVGFTLFGSLFAIWAKFTMKSIWGMPAQHDMKRQNKLVTQGPFSFSRNPIYVGLFSIFLGIELALGSMFILLTIPLTILIHKGVLKEERLLAKYFKEYASYKKKVPRYL